MAVDKIITLNTSSLSLVLTINYSQASTLTNKPISDGIFKTRIVTVIINWLNLTVYIFK